MLVAVIFLVSACGSSGNSASGDGDNSDDQENDRASNSDNGVREGGQCARL